MVLVSGHLGLARALQDCLDIVDVMAYQEVLDRRESLRMPKER